MKFSGYGERGDVESCKYVSTMVVNGETLPRERDMSRNGRDQNEKVSGSMDESRQGTYNFRRPP